MTRWILLITAAICAKVAFDAVNQDAHMYAALAVLVGFFALWAWSRVFLWTEKVPGSQHSKNP